MPRPLRYDAPGMIRHVVSRGHSRRGIFESRFDARLFLSLLARAARAGRFEVLSFVVMITHFHLLVRSIDGEIWRHIQWFKSLYASYFNRTRTRRGSTFDGRFKSKLVQSDRYERAVVYYIDNNPVKSNIVRIPHEYPFGSASCYVHRRGPLWLERAYVERMACSITGAGGFTPSVYMSAFGGDGRDGMCDVIERALVSPGDPFREIDDLVGASPAHVQRWLAENARNADGANQTTPIAAAATIRAFVATAREREPDRSLRLTRRARPFWSVLEAGLLRQVCRLSAREIAESLGRARATVREWVEAHNAAIGRDREYTTQAAAVLGAAVDRDFGWLVKMAG
jgi:REP element-mobilizing transposase RayT